MDKQKTAQGLKTLGVSGWTISVQTNNSMKYLFLIIFHLFATGLLLAQEFVLDDGIYFEKPLYRDTSLHKYSLDNISYKVNSIFIYDYYFINKDSIKNKSLHKKEFSFQDNPLNLISYDNVSDNIIDKIKIEVNDDRTQFGNDSDYTQTVFCYSYLNRLGKSADTVWTEYSKDHPNFVIPCSDESTGIVDNKKNLWIHPPRQYIFKILQLNPFPFYCLDETIKTWSSNLNVGGTWLDQRWINFQKEEIIKIHFSYKRRPDEIIESPVGSLKCKVTEGTGTSLHKDIAFKTYLKSFYHPKFGFVRLEYTNINGTKLVIQLIDAK